MRDHLNTKSIGENQLDKTVKTPDQNNQRTFFTYSGYSYKGRAALLFTSQHATDPGHNG